MKKCSRRRCSVTSDGHMTYCIVDTRRDARRACELHKFVLATLASRISAGAIRFEWQTRDEHRGVTCLLCVSTGLVT